MPLEAYQTHSDLGGELYVRHIEYRLIPSVPLAEIMKQSVAFLDIDANGKGNPVGFSPLDVDSSGK